MAIMKRNKSKKRFLSVALALAMTVTMTATIPSGVKTVKAAEATISNPRVEYNTRDTIEFGHYLQEDTNNDGKVDDKDTKQPIKWQILSKSSDGKDLFLLADKALDCKDYNEEYTSVTWETCTLRNWLNDTSSDESFINTAFTSTEQKGIVTTTAGKVYLLSLDEVANASYGFRSDKSYDDQSRICEATAYAKSQGAYTNDEGSSWWWLRSPGPSDDAANVVDCGYAVADGDDVSNRDDAVRPALHLNLSSLNSSDYKLCKKKNVSVKSSTYDLVELGSYNGKALQWRVLSKDGNDAFLLADRYVTKKGYNDKASSVTWEKCTLRSWLNGDFYNSTFNSSEKAAIKEAKYENADNPLYDTEGGNDTNDKVTLLSLTDIVNPNYGFPAKYWCESETRVATSLESDGTSQYGSWWWLRSPGYGSSAAHVGNNGYAYANGDNVDYDCNYAVRPALHLDLSSLSSLKVVGTVVAGEDGIKYYDTEGKQVSGDVSASHTHTYGNWKVVKAATETSEGKEERSCACGAKESRPIEKLPHTHTYGKWRGEKATVFKTGTKTRTCSSCGKTETATIAKLKPTIKLSKKKATLKKGQKLTVKVSKLAKGDSVKSWKSSNKKVATVSKKGKIIAKKNGKATITVTLKSGKKAKVKITVK